MIVTCRLSIRVMRYYSFPIFLNYTDSEVDEALADPFGNDTFVVGSGRTRNFCLSSFKTTNCTDCQLGSLHVKGVVLTSLVKDIASNNRNRGRNNRHGDFSGYIVVAWRQAATACRTRRPWSCASARCDIRNYFLVQSCDRYVRFRHRLRYLFGFGRSSHSRYLLQGNRRGRRWW
jgi:hypothetical protein